jgi:hypothetical protein
MNLKDILNEARFRGEKVKNEVVAELFKSKTLQDIVGNKHFIKALTRVIHTKDEVKKAISTQMQNIFDVMEVPSRADIIKIAGKLGNLEKVIEKIGRSTIAVNILPKLKSSARPSKVHKPAVVRRKTKARKGSRKTARQ